jgi:hypothetical protein
LGLWKKHVKKKKERKKEGRIQEETKTEFLLRIEKVLTE